MKFSERRGLCKNLYPEDATVFCGRWPRGICAFGMGTQRKTVSGVQSKCIPIYQTGAIGIQLISKDPFSFTLTISKVQM